ncbi:Imm49 family immunity protein [Actinomadura macrotermitis]|uniref:Immunity 49 family protein n=1 Tax=Actinomadura macrotermitis TaxID=2585200 RepID=A0A7K0BQ21_9ACTN|nr:Imm49 family immunity protein [Actinomadura macrotermitis]MQY03289.1 hypothetical protein [Actinomadura macrotermitis]
MSVNRRSVPESAVRKALDAVPDELDRTVKLAQYGGPYSIELISDMLLEYVAALSVTDDPGIERRDTWKALRSAAELAAEYVQACATPVGEEARGWVEYLGVGFGFTVEDEETIFASDWAHAFHLALICRDERKLKRLSYSYLHPDDDAQAKALLAYQAGAPLDDGFQAMVDAAVQRWQADTTRVKDLLPWELLGLAALAHDRGEPLEIDGLPERLVTGAGPKKAEAAGPVPRHPFEAEFAERWLGSSAELDQGSIKKCFRPEVIVSMRGSAFHHFLQDRLMTFRFRSVLDPAAEDVRQWTELVLAGQAYVAYFRLERETRGTEVEIALGDHTQVLTASGSRISSPAWEYRTAVAVALATRDRATLDFLAGLDEGVLRSGHDLPDTLEYALALRALLAGEDPRPHVDRALAKGGDEHWECLRDPYVRLLDRLVADDPEGFDTVLAEALNLYRDYYPSNDVDIDSMFSFDALGLACLAHDRGWPVAVESDFLPRRLVEGAWLGTPPDLSRY